MKKDKRYFFLFSTVELKSALARLAFTSILLVYSPACICVYININSTVLNLKGTNEYFQRLTTLPDDTYQLYYALGVK